MSLATPHPLSLSPHKREREETYERGQSSLSYLRSLRKRNIKGELKRGEASLI